MGFPSLEDFNQALLAKQGWRLLTNPTALWVRVLKAGYFVTSTFLDARKGSSPSWLWSSLLQGRELLHHHVVWQIGSIYSSPHCSGGGGFGSSSGSSSDWAMQPLVEHIQALTVDMGSHSWEWTSRLANQAADHMALLVRQRKCPTGWFQFPPSSCTRILLLETGDAPT
ncbi:hypothetical protein ACLB2K_016015 [Fragaria x ananassa]